MIETIHNISQLTKSYINNHPVYYNGHLIKYEELQSVMTGITEKKYKILNTQLKIEFDTIKELKDYVGKVLNQEAFIAALKDKFPQGWFKKGDEFNEDHIGSVWSGTSDLDDPLFNSNAWEVDPKERIYVDEVRRSLVHFSHQKGWYWQSYDCATFFAYQIGD